MIHWELAVAPWLVLALVNFFLSWFYYSPLMPWFKTWATGIGMDLNKKEMTEAEKKSMPFLFLSGLVGSLLLSYGLQVVVHSLGADSFVGGLGIGVVCWATFAITGSLNTLWEGRKPKVLVINNGLYLLTYAIFGGLVAVWR